MTPYVNTTWKDACRAIDGWDQIWVGAPASCRHGHSFSNVFVRRAVELEIIHIGWKGSHGMHDASQHAHVSLSEKIALENDRMVEEMHWQARALDEHPKQSGGCHGHHNRGNAENTERPHTLRVHSRVRLHRSCICVLLFYRSQRVHCGAPTGVGDHNLYACYRSLHTWCTSYHCTFETHLPPCTAAAAAAAASTFGPMFFLEAPRTYTPVLGALPRNDYKAPTIHASTLHSDDYRVVARRRRGRVKLDTRRLGRGEEERNGHIGRGRGELN